MAPRKIVVKKTPENKEVERILRQISPRGSELADGFWHAPLDPPITLNSLAELDMPRIINNPKLRHDVNFDRELHFRPNLDGSKGKQKLESAELYWKALEGELVMCAFAQMKKRDADYKEKEAYWQALLTNSLLRLPNAFKAIRDILKTLVPDTDQQAIIDRLDVDLIMREICQGMCDLVDLAKWLNKVLKNHCAPMRDDMVDRMQREIIRGATEQKPAKLVNGLKQLLNVLEAMKLDVANHQIRHMRSIMVDDAVNFQRCYNAHRIKSGKIDGWQAKMYVEVERHHIRIGSEEEVNPTPLDGLVSALLRSLIYPDFAVPYPATFYLDVERLRAIRMEIQQAIFHQICRDNLREMAGGARAPPQALNAALGSLYMTVSAIVGPTGQFVENLDNIAVEIMRMVLMIEGRSTTTYDPVLHETVQERLEIDLQLGSGLYERYARIIFERLLPKLKAGAEHDVRLSALQLQDKHVPHVLNPLSTHALSYGAVCSPVGTPSPPPHPGAPGPYQQQYPTGFYMADPDDDLVRRFTHIVALHWQIWAPIVYFESFETLDEASVAEGPPSPTVPVAQAVYAPGHKWLPVGITVTEVPSGLPTPPTSPEPRDGAKEKEGEGESEPGKKTDLEGAGGQQESAA